MATTNTLDTSSPNGPPNGLLGMFRSVSRPSLAAFGVALLVIASGSLTYGIVTGGVAYTPTSSVMLALLLVNLTLVLSLGALIAWRLTRLWAERKSGSAGARLHVRLVTMFSLIAVIPAVFVAVFAVFTLNLGIEQWFAPRVKGAIENSIAVAERYVKEHENSITADALSIANGIEQDPRLFDENRHVKADFLFAQLQDMARDRGLQAAYIYDSHGTMLGSTKEQGAPDTKPPSPSDFAQASGGNIVIDANSHIGVVRALIRMQALNDAYLLVLRKVDPTVFAYYQRTTAASAQYKLMERNRAGMQIIFAELYGMVSVLMLLAAIWMGLWAANRLVRPISQLIGAAERVSAGDLRAQVAVERSDDEVGVLGHAFNRMTSQLRAQRAELVEASHQIDMRRRFTEAVLAGVSAGVVGLDNEGNVTLLNRAAERLLDAAPQEIEGQHYSQVMPELSALIRKAVHEPVGRASGEVSVKRAGKVRNLSVQVDSERGDAGFVVTFDDITDLVSAQRTAAWADVARRIAHEIKNPLTPIQLSAERLKRKYTREVTTDPEIFNQCVDTIVRQVGDIGRMVDEFSSFARMPQPVMRQEVVQELVQQAVFLQREGNPQIAYTTKMPPDMLRVECDGRLISQALTNVLKNAGESISTRIEKGDDAPGKIEIQVEPSDDRVFLRVIDNGVGLPPEHKHRLTEPYVTTRAKGTGLGLAIVRKIFEDHGGELSISDRSDDRTGAEVFMVLPLRQKKVREAGVEKTEVGDEQERIFNRA
jgi:two-component system nitrogen regulation sensor histidine kinase NtrY